MILWNVRLLILRTLQKTKERLANRAYRPVRQFIAFPSFCRMMLACGYCWLKMMRGLRDS